MRVSQYKLVAANKFEDFNNEMAKALAEGWQPWQAPFMTSSVMSTYFVQAVVKYS
jgi:hypothetical protein